MTHAASCRYAIGNLYGLGEPRVCAVAFDARTFSANGKTAWETPCRRPPIRDGPTTTTTIIFQKSFASDATPKRHSMAHQMKNLCDFSVFHCVEGAFGASSGGTPKMKNGAPRDELKNGRGHRWAVPYLSSSCA